MYSKNFIKSTVLKAYFEHDKIKLIKDKLGISAGNEMKKLMS